MGAADMPVRLFREILIWPLAVEPVPGTSLKATVTAFGKRLDGHPAWTAIRDLRRHLDDDPHDTAPLSADAYAEVVYFHPFVQRFLFPAPDRAGKPAMRLFRRMDVTRVRLDSGDRVFELSVDRVHLYLFDSGIAVLAVEVSSLDGHLTLEDVQRILSGLRHAYPPYFATLNDGTIVPAHCLDAVEWLCDAPGAPERGLTAEPDNRVTLRRSLTERSHPPTIAHWRALLTPLSVRELRHVVDDRIPTMVLVGVEDPHGIDRGDLMRLCFADEPGTSRLPYARGFLRNFEKNYCYDRFWQRKGGWLSTRYLCSGYNFAMVGQAYEAERDEDGFLRHILDKHFRRHYFQIGLLAHHQKAALLTLSDAVSQAVDKGRLDGEMERLHLRALEFTHRFWFTDVTNQIQGQELFELWTRHLNTRAIFEQVNREVTESSTYRSTQAALRLNRIAGYGLVLALTSGILGMNVLVGGKWTKPDDVAELGMVLFAVIVGMAIVSWGYARDWPPWVTVARRGASAVLFAAAVVAMIGFGVAVFQHSPETPLCDRLSVAWAALTAR